jgi:asparagine synthase (glutamine-hydrolysing)
MCGIIGHISTRKAIDIAAFEAMRDTLTHRGPDGFGANYFENDSIALGHRRLSFLDLSESGAQPMCNEDETIWITLNGEIYNYLELREELVQLGHTFKSNSDTEVIVHGYEAWGYEVVNKIKGMFAFGLLDLNKQKLWLVRDRFGIKPLYYTQFDSQFIFASELKAIVKCKDVIREMDMRSFADYFVYRYIPSPNTIWKNIAKLPPAHYLVYDIETHTKEINEYWKLDFQEGKLNPNLIEDVNEILKQSVAIHARSDVPIGSFLSGGYDSSAIVYYLSSLGFKPDTFSIGFENWQNSEDQFAEMVAQKFGVPHHSLIVNEKNLDLLSIMPEVYDEPIADISILPTWLVSNNAVKQVKAVMSGEGADELFGGYNWQKEFFAQSKKKSFFQKVISMFFKEKHSKTVSFYANAMGMGRFDAVELRSMLHTEHHKYIREDVDWFYRNNFDCNLSPLKSIQKMDIKCFMGELVLTKVDRASMANSLEVRVPFLDQYLYQKVFSQNEKNYFKPNETKHLLYQNLKQQLPDEVLNRGKQGFVGPDAFYMKADWYRKTLDHATLIADGIVQKDYYLQLLAKEEYWKLWKLNVMEHWYKHWVKEA